MEVLRCLQAENHHVEERVEVIQVIQLQELLPNLFFSPLLIDPLFRSFLNRPAKFAFSKHGSVANSQNNWKECSDDAGDFRNGFPSLELS